jgi:hypothetical protein
MWSKYSMLTRTGWALALGLASALSTSITQAQIDEDQNGAWYVYQWTRNPGDNGIGLQGDIQHRNWSTSGDIEQLLARGGITWTPQGSTIKYTFGVAAVHSEAFGPSDAASQEIRLYQEALMPQRLGARLLLTHRWRFEQRDVEGQDMRTRLRYLIGLNYPFNRDNLGKGAVYLAFTNEVFVNLERGIGRGRSVDHFDRNRAYAGLGYSVTDSLRLQFGYLEQTLDASRKGQLQFNVIHTF